MRRALRLEPPTLMHVLAEVPTWHSDRIVLVGGAGQPVGAGQGASMAIEDAVVLARALEQHSARRRAGRPYAAAAGAHRQTGAIRRRQPRRQDRRSGGTPAA
ncbi:hypothetical protein ACFFWE_30150 [Sphaerisporangium melleum]|uniref:hypothetical protein n=1 Tax=Sphaerisporangium melleum TaxID=321316 RepID=UPI0016665356|nr:hypothetical protein [Sphaerisporangium melleum]